MQQRLKQMLRLALRFALLGAQPLDFASVHGRKRPMLGQRRLLFTTARPTPPETPGAAGFETDGAPGALHYAIGRDYGLYWS